MDRIEKLTYQEYDAIEALNAGKLKSMAISPRHAQVFRERSSTPSLRIGSMAHLAVLEPDVFSSSVAVSKNFDRRYKDQKALALQFEEENAGKTIIDHDTYTTICSISEALAEHPAAHKLLTRCRRREESIIWQDNAGVLCKSRPDMFNEELGICCDLKTIKAGDGKPENFLRSALSFERLYHWQAAFYLRGFQKLGLPIHRWIWIVVETSEPFGVSCVQASSDMIEYARQCISPLIEQYADCAQKGAWPAYSDKIEEPDTPQWILDKLYG